MHRASRSTDRQHPAGTTSAAGLFVAFGLYWLADTVTQLDGFNVVFDDLAPGDVVVQLHALGLPPDLPDAEYRLQIGGYRREDLERIPLSVDAADNILWLRTWGSVPGLEKGP